MPSLGEACHDERLVRGCLNWHCFLLVGVVVKLYLSLSTPSYVETYPLWTGSTTVDAAVVLICLCDLTQLGAGLRVDLPHFTHLGCVACGLLNVVRMRRRGVLLLARESGRDGGETAEAGPLVRGMLYFWCWMLLLYCHVICL